MNEFGKPTLENYVFTNHNKRDARPPDIEVEIVEAIEKIVKSIETFKHEELCVLYFKSHAASNQYVLTSTEKLRNSDNFWVDISLKLFLLLYENMDFEFLYNSDAGKVFHSEEFTPEEMIKRLVDITRKGYLEQILQNL